MTLQILSSLLLRWVRWFSRLHEIVNTIVYNSHHCSHWPTSSPKNNYIDAYFLQEIQENLTVFTYQSSLFFYFKQTSASCGEGNVFDWHTTFIRNKRFDGTPESFSCYRILVFSKVWKYIFWDYFRSLNHLFFIFLAAMTFFWKPFLI